MSDRIIIDSFKEFVRKTFMEMHTELTNDEIIAENRRKEDRKKRIEAKKKDTGL